MQDMLPILTELRRAADMQMELDSLVEKENYFLASHFLDCILQGLPYNLVLAYIRPARLFKLFKVNLISLNLEKRMNRKILSPIGTY